jgi:TonB family protein
MLVLRCQSAEVEAYIDWHDYMGSDASDVTTRLGTAPPERSQWSHSTDEKATFYPGDHTQFLESLLLVDRFVAQATPYNESPITAVFVLSGLAQAVVPLKAACALNPRRDDRKNPTELGIESDVATGMVPSSDQVYMESVVDERPEVLSGPQLQYPDLLREASIQGRVLVQAIIDTTGRVEPQSVKVIQSPNPGFDQPAKNYVLRALFRPARLHGRAVRVLINLPIDFKIKR